jgi:hypothetical protein
MNVDFIGFNPECTVISEWNNTEDEEARNKSTIVLATGSPYQSNEGPLQRDEVKATFNKEESKDNACKSLASDIFLTTVSIRYIRNFPGIVILSSAFVLSIKEIPRNDSAKNDSARKITRARSQASIIRHGRHHSVHFI